MNNGNKKQNMTDNERNETRFLQLKEIISKIQAKMEGIGRGNNDPTPKQEEASPMENISFVQPKIVGNQLQA